ncbi:MAG: 2TM domain-containing protein [Gaiellaceae bacterium]
MSDLHEEALQSLEKKREFRVHLAVYLVVNALIWLGWGFLYTYTGFWFPWPLFPLIGWGIGLGFHAWDAYGRRPFTPEQIEREAARLRAAH